MFKINKKTFSTNLIVLGLFTLFSIPSLKIIYSTSAINVLAILLLILGTLFHNRNYLDKVKKRLLVFWTIFSIVLLLSTYNGINFNSLKEYSEYIYLLVAIYIIIFNATWYIFKNVTFLLFLWGFILALWQLFFRIDLNITLGQNYLTLSMPIGIALAYSFRFIFNSNDYLLKRVFFFCSFILIFLSLATLLSRSVFIINAFILFILTLGYLFINKKVSILRKMVFILVMLFISLLMGVYAIDNIDFSQAYRIERLLNNLETEPRAISYVRDIGLIFDSILFGYGLNSYSFITNELYPHNIFLEILFYGGLLLLIPFLLIFTIYIITIYKSLRLYFDNTYIILGVSISLFYFLQFNLSFPLSSAYISIGYVILFIIGFAEIENKIFLKEKNDISRYTNT